MSNIEIEPLTASVGAHVLVSAEQLLDQHVPEEACCIALTPTSRRQGG